MKLPRIVGGIVLGCQQKPQTFSLAEISRKKNRTIDYYINR
jgi:hypothetical protein